MKRLNAQEFVTNPPYNPEQTLIPIAAPPQTDQVFDFLGPKRTTYKSKRNLSPRHHQIYFNLEDLNTTDSESDFLIQQLPQERSKADSHVLERKAMKKLELLKLKP